MADLEESLQKLLISSQYSDILPTLIDNNGEDVNNTIEEQFVSEDSKILKAIDSFLLNEDYEKVISDFFKRLTNYPKTLDPSLVDSILADGPMERHLEVLSVGVAALQLFVQINWAGKHCLEDTQVKSLMSEYSYIPKEIRMQVLVETVNGEGVESVVKNTELLFIAIVCLIGRGNVENVFKDSWSIQWWQLRCLYVHQQILTEKSDVIYQEALRLIEKIERYFQANLLNFEGKVMSANRKNESVKLYTAYLSLEVSAFYGNYFDVTNMTKVN